MTTNRTSWETMQRKQLALSCAKDAKALYAQELEKLRLTLDYLRSLQHWITVASSHRTLKARKLALTEYQSRPAMMERETAARTICYWDLVPANCQENIRNAISWAHTATSSPTFKDWQECCDSAGACIGDAMCQLDVVRARVKSSWMQARANMIAARTVIDTCAKDILHPVALSKKEKAAIAKRNIMQTVGNSYHLVSAAACITQRVGGTLLYTKLWLRLVRTTRYNHVHRNATNFNNRQDYLVRFPEYRTGIIDGRNLFVGSI